MARALAVMGMIIVNFKVVLGSKGAVWLEFLSHLFEGKAAATFVFLAGLGLALMSKKAIEEAQPEKIQQIKILKRALFLFVIGLSYIWIWPADILHFYGIYMLLVLLFLKSSPKKIIGFSVFLILIYPVMVLLFNYEQSWNFSTLEYADFWTFKGFFRNLFYNGFHPLIPWAAFMLFGFAFGKMDLTQTKFLKKSLRISVIMFFGIQLISVIGVSIFKPLGLEFLFLTDPMPPLPIYMFNGISFAVFITTASILLAKRFPTSKTINTLNKTGQLALTFYVAHVVIGMAAIEILGAQPLGTYSLEFSMIYSIVFIALCILFSILWLGKYKLGPLEFLMRRLLDGNTK